MRRARSVFTAFVLAAAFLLVGFASAHPIPQAWDGYTRMLADCHDDYGYHADRPHLKGHEIHGLDVKEVDEGVRMMIIYQKKFPGASAGSVSTPEDPDYPMRDTLSFKIGGRTFTSTLTTNGDAVPSVLGTSAFASARHDVRHTVPGSGDVNGHDDRRYGLELTYSYQTLGVKNGDRITDFSISGEVNTGVGWQRGDIMPGGFYDSGVQQAGCGSDNGSDVDGVHGQMPYRHPTGYLVSHIPHTDPVAAFSVTPEAPKANQPVAFADASHDADNAIASWSWAFGDGATSTARSPTHTYAAAGSYVVRLTVTDATERVGVMTRTLQVAPEGAVNTAPTANFQISPVAPRTGQTVTFTDTSTDAEGPLHAWRWSFGDGNTSTQTNATHTYARPGNYTVELAVTDVGGLEASLSRPLQIQNRAPVASIVMAATARVNETITFAHESADPDGTIAALHWSFGDGTTSTDATATRSYATAGDYEVRLRVTDDLGATNEAVRRLTVLPEAVVPPRLTAAADRLQAPTGSALNFSATAEGPAPIVSWKWNFGDEGTAEGREVSHTFERAGARTVILRVTDERGVSNETRIRIEIANRPPVVELALPDRIELGEAVTPIATAIDPDGSVASWEWDFGDGSRASAKSVLHAYAATGPYTIRLRVTDELGGVTEVSRAIRVVVDGSREPEHQHGHGHPHHHGDPGGPTARFDLSAERVARNQQIRFTDASTGAIERWLWTTGDGAVYRTPNFEYHYVTLGDYEVALTVTDAMGRTATAKRTIEVVDEIAEPAPPGTPTVADEPAVLAETQDPAPNQTPAPGIVALVGAAVGLALLRRRRGS